MPPRQVYPKLVVAVRNNIDSLLVGGTLAAFAFEVHLAYAPGEAEADETAVVAPAVVFGVVGVGGDGVRVGGLEKVVDLEVEREVAVEEVGTEAEVDVEVRFAATEELNSRTDKLAVDKHVHLAP